MHILTYSHTEHTVPSVVDVNSYHPLWKVRTGLQRKVQADVSELCTCFWWAGHNPVLIWNPYNSISTMLSLSQGSFLSVMLSAEAGHHARSELTCLVTWKHRQSTVSVVFTCTWSNATGLCANIFSFFSFTSHRMYWKTLNLCIHCNNVQLFSFQKQPCEFAQNYIILTKS